MRVSEVRTVRRRAMSAVEFGFLVLSEDYRFTLFSVATHDPRPIQAMSAARSAGAYPASGWVEGRSGAKPFGRSFRPRFRSCGCPEVPYPSH